MLNQCESPSLSLFRVKDLAISSDETKVFLTLQMLGTVLHKMSCEYSGPVQSRRPFSDKLLKVGEPNLLVTPNSEQHHLHYHNNTQLIHSNYCFIVTSSHACTKMMFSRQHLPCTWRMQNRPSKCQPMRRCWYVVNRPQMRRSFYCGGEHLVIQTI